MSVRVFFSIITAVFLMFFFAGQSAWTADQQSQATQDIAASVDGKTISRAQLEDTYLKWKKRSEAMGQTIPEDQVTQTKKRILEQLVTKELLRVETEREKIAISNKDVEEAIAQMKKSFPTEEAFQDALSKAGMKLSDLEGEVREQRAIRTLLETKIGKDFQVTDAEAEAFYNSNKEMFKRPMEVKASHILAKVDKNAGPEADKKAKDKIEAVLKRLQKGDDFAAVAKEESEDATASRGGDLGVFRKESMVPEFAEVAFSLKAGEMSGVVKTTFGYHIIKVMEIHPEGYESYEQAKERLTRFLKLQEQGKKTTEYIESLRKKSNVQIMF